MANFKTLIDDNGNQFVFNWEAFNETIKERTQKKQIEGKLNKVFVKDILMSIAETCCVSVDAVKNWKQGYNGPGDIECIKTASKILGVDYHVLLTPLNKEKENKMFTSNEKMLISDVYSKLLSFYFKFYDPSKDLFSNIGEELNTQQKRIAKSVMMDKELSEIHDFISTQSLFISSIVINNLHRIVADIEDEPQLSEHDSEHWVCFDDMYCIYDSKEEIIRAENNFSNAYIIDEIALAEDLGYDYNSFDEEAFFNDKGKTEEEMVEIRKNMGVTEIEIKPIAVFKH